MTAAIRTEGLTKVYRHDVRGVTDLDLEVRPGEIFGYLGPNGAGKTTTIRLLLDLIRPTRGRAEVLGLDTRRDSLAIRRRLGYLPGELALYERLTVRELLSHFGHLRGAMDWTYTTAIAARLDLPIDPPIRALSKGNKQKVGLVQALMHRPEVLILDEPTAGLDPLVQQDVHELLFEARGEGRTVFLSSHVLSEVERVADRVGIIRDGRLATVEDVAALKARAVRRLHAVLAAPVAVTAFEDVPGVVEANVDGAEVHLTAVTGSMDALVKALARFEVIDLTVHEPDLEEIFLAFYGREEASGAA